MPSENPLVSCILLSMGEERAAMHARAVRSYESQTYENRELIVYEGPRSMTIGEMRNVANKKSHGSILAHWDQDDWSHPNRLAEQVALLQSTGADCVGYNEMLFWDTRATPAAWLYSYPDPSYCLGTSMMYWRAAWERRPFDHVSHGEDERWRKGVKSVGVSSMPWRDSTTPSMPLGAPRMIASIHGGNTSPWSPENSPAMCRRVPEWDGFCERTMRL